MRAPAALFIAIGVLFMETVSGAGLEAPYVERLSPALDAIVPADVVIEVIATGFEWTEGPLWVESTHALLFSDVPANIVYAWREGKRVSEWLKPSGYTGTRPRGGEPGANGLALDADGQLLLCQHGDRRIARLTAPLAAPEPAFETVAARYDGRRFNSPNDLIVDASGNVWFTDPPYGLEGGADDPARELEVFGVYRIDSGGGVELIIDDLSRPNGIGLSPDESVLYVSNSDPERAIWMSYRIGPDGSLSDGAVFFDATAEVDDAPGLPDGLKVDRRGNLFATGPGGVWIFSPEGEPLGRIVTGRAAANVAFNGDESVLYITADDRVLRVEL